MEIKNTKNELRTKAEFALMGYVQRVSSKEDVIFVLDIIKSALDCMDVSAEQLYDMAVRYIDAAKTEIYGLSCSTVYDMKCVNIIFKDKDVDFDLCDDDGVLCYVINFDEIHFSELGYSFFA
ncbi:MAG TPA: hypothetical protein DEP65_01800, partial [Ruminococcus sp.]|nr:hypothetical protein [Ruminococcus sp.]